MFFSNTFLSSLLINFSTNTFITDDLPALVYPTSATLGMLDFFLLFFWVFLWYFSISNSLFKLAILSSIRLRSSSNLVSPAPLFLVPTPPLWRPRFSLAPINLGSSYWSLATSTCNLASLVFALFANISSIKAVLSMTLHFTSSSIFFICDADNSLLNTIISAFISSIKSRNSSILPLPI